MADGIIWYAKMQVTNLEPLPTRKFQPKIPKPMGSTQHTAMAATTSPMINFEFNLAGAEYGGGFCIAEIVQHLLQKVKKMIRKARIGHPLL